MIGKSSKSARHTGELTLSRAIAFVYVTTGGTGAGRITRVYKDHRNTHALRLVGDKRPELEERPTMQRGALAATNRNPLANAFEVFESNRPLRVFRLRHKLLGDNVIHISGKARLFAGQLTQPTPRRLGAFALQLGAQAAVTLPDAIDLTGRMHFTVRVNGDIRHAQVNAQRALNVNRFRFLHFAGGRQEERAAERDQIGFALARFQKRALPLSTDERDVQATLYRPDRDSRLGKLPGKDTVIVGNAPCGPERALTLTVELVGIGNLANHPHGDLSRKPELRPDSLIAQVMQVVLPEGLGFPRRITHKPTGGVGLFQRPLERVGLFGSREQFDLSYQLHANNYSTNTLKLQVGKSDLLAFFDVSIVPRKEGSGFLHPLKGVVSAAEPHEFIQ